MAEHEADAAVAALKHVHVPAETSKAAVGFIKMVSLVRYNAYQFSKFFNSIKPNLYNDCNESRLQTIFGDKTGKGGLLFYRSLRS